MWKTRLVAILLLFSGAFVGYFDYSSETDPESDFKNFPFKFGLDLIGGTHLLYHADVSEIEPLERASSMDALRDVIERRINLFGVAEPVVQVEEVGAFKEPQDREYRLIVELPGVTDINKAISLIGETPLLEFMTERPDGPEKEAILEAHQKALEAREKLLGVSTSTESSGVELSEVEGIDEFGDVFNDPLLKENPFYEPTELTGALLAHAQLTFEKTLGEPTVSLTFNEEGKKLFADMTTKYTGRTIAIFLDRHLGNIDPITAPVVNEPITDGNAVISGNFNLEEAKQLVGRLNSGALPVPIELLTTQTIGASLGEEALAAGVNAGKIGLFVVAIFLILWYRLPGVLATIALAIYVAIMLALFKLIGVTLTAAGIAGFILSIGMAVDANILIFERMKEELREGKALRDSIHDGFARAWLSIRDGNISSVITAVILFWFGTSLVEGFALTFGIGVLVSMFSAITITRTLLVAVSMEEHKGLARILFGSGISK